MKRRNFQLCIFINSFFSRFSQASKMRRQSASVVRRLLSTGPPRVPTTFRDSVHLDDKILLARAEARDIEIRAEHLKLHTNFPSASQVRLTLCSSENRLSLLKLNRLQEKLQLIKMTSDESVLSIDQSREDGLRLCCSLVPILTV